jgi:hypothetical protein
MKKSSVQCNSSTSKRKSDVCVDIKKMVFAGVILATVYTSNQAEAAIIDYGTLGTFQTPSLDCHGQSVARHS